MKIVFSLLFLLGVDYSQGTDDYWLGHENGYDAYSALGPQNSYERLIGLDQPCNRKRQDLQNDDHIVRPCCLNDLSCIRRSLVYYNVCLPTYSPMPDPYIHRQVDIPHANITITINNAQHKGINYGRIIEFYVNKKTGILILEVVFDSLVFYSPKIVVTFHRKGKEPVEITDYATAEYRKLSLTLTQSVYSKNLDKGHVYTYVSDTKTPIKRGPGLEATPKDSNMKWITELPLTIREAMTVQGPLYFNMFLQNYVCGFEKQ